MEKLQIQTTPELIKYIKELLQHVSEFIYNNSYYYKFKVDSHWYDVFYINNYGFELTLRKGVSSDLTDYDIICSTDCKGTYSTNRKAADELFKEIEDIYSAHKIAKNEKFVSIAKQYINLIENCDNIEKFSENLFLLTFGNKKISFTRIDKFKNGENYLSLIVKKHNDSKEDTIQEIEDYQITVSMIYHLNSMYYLFRNKAPIEPIITKIINSLNE